jgi:paraquat-inducible protein B
VVLRAQLEREARVVRRTGTRVLVVAPDAGLRQVMGTNTMVAAKRKPVASATYDYARHVFAAGL